MGPMDVRLENIHSDSSPANYVSFLNQAQRGKLKGSGDSIHSVSSIRSVMSTMTSLWSSLGLSSKSTSKSEKHKAAEREDLKYLYSSFTKVPCLKLAPDHKAPLIAGYEEFPFDSAVPLFAFKNLSTLEICDIDFRQFFGWDRLADPACGVRSLTLKRACVDDPADILVNIVLDDMDRRRRRSAKQPTSPIVGWPAPSPGPRHAQLVGSHSAPPSPPRDGRSSTEGAISSSLESRGSTHRRRRSGSPTRPGSSRQASAISIGRGGTPIRRSSGSSNSSIRGTTPRGSSSTLLSLSVPIPRWRCLRHLSLCDNGLTAISASSLAPVSNTLQSLDLSCNLFTEIPDSLASLVSLRALNLSHCMIESLHSLVRNPLPAITVLNLRANRLASLAGIERLLSLERIDLRENRLTDPTEVARLTGIPNMIDVYVHKNQFVKTHGAYRVTIFNLFRKTPGYTEDVYVDGTQPLYSERKHLVDRVPELPNVPIIKAPVAEDDATYPQIARDPPPARPNLSGLSGTEKESRLERRVSELGHHRRKSEYGSSGNRKKKGPRRRVVEIAHQEASDASSDAPQLETAVMGPPPPREPPSSTLADQVSNLRIDTQTSPAIPARSSSISAMPSAISDLPPQIPPVEMTPPMSRADSSPAGHATSPMLQAEYAHDDSGLYRQKIEALRNDLGSGWLTALGDEAWDGRTRPNEFDGSYGSTGPLTPPTAPARSTSQSIVSGGRTLG